ncbi:MAG: hypothetical protein IJ373_07290, partial [Clostridia bacterium]|nr:hypothetical protein [Clostridia bacterium]
SESSNSRALISAIKPKNVVISALANSEDSVNKYWGFPKQEVLDTFLAATDNVYITSRYDANTGSSYQYYGHITFKMDRTENVELHCSNYASDSIPQLTKTVWFQENRTVSLQTFVFSGYESASKAYLGNCTLIQRGKTDILIDCGNYPDATADYASDHFVRKVAQYCLDGVLEYVIVTSPSLYAYSQICDPDGDKKGILSTFDVQTLIDYGQSNDPSQNAKVSVYKKYNEAKAAFVAESENEYKTAKECVGKTIDLGDGLSMEILDNEYYDELGKEEYENVVCTMIHYHDRKLLFTGNIGEKGEESIADRNNLSGTDFFLASDFGSNAANSEILLDEIKNEGLFIAVGSVAGEDFIRTPLPKKVACMFHDRYSQNTFITVSRDENGGYTDVMGDLVFAVRKKGSETVCSMRGTHEKARSEKDVAAFQLCNTRYYKSL